MADVLQFVVPIRNFPRRERRYRHNNLNIQGLTDAELRIRYRFGSQAINYITNLLYDDLVRDTDRNFALIPDVQVLIALRFLASGSFLQVIGDTFGVDKSTVSRVVRDVCAALSNKREQFIRWPSNQEKEAMKNGFYEMARFPGVIGCIDGTHIRIQAPHLDENFYVNRKRYHSINVQAICDDRGKFINVVARWPGSVHDSHIFRTSQIQEYLEQHHTSLEDGILLGDSGYALKPYLMTPYSDPTTAKERAFNRSLRKTRVLIEQVFGRWKRRFHLLHSEIRMKPEKVCLLIGACAILQNIAIMFNEPEEDEDIDLEEPEVEAHVGHDTGRQIRAHITNNFF